MCCYVMSNGLTFSTVLGFINGFLFEDYADLFDFLADLVGAPVPHI